MVLSDINMPRMDGLSLLAKLQEAEEKLSTVIVSAYGDMANIRTAMNSRRLRLSHEADRFFRPRDDDRQDHPPHRCVARGEAPSIRGRTRPCDALALFLAQPRRAPGE